LKNASYIRNPKCDMNIIFGSERGLKGSIIWFQIEIQQRNWYDIISYHIFVNCNWVVIRWQ